MKENWTYKKLGEVCDVSAGQGAPQGNENYCDDGTPFVKAGNLEELVNGLDESCIQKVNEEVARTHKLKLYKAGSVVFAKSGMSCMKGLVYTLRHDCYVVSHLAILTPKGVDPSFLNYSLNHFKPNTLVKDEAYPSISLGDISKLSIPVPPIETQSRIVSELDLLQSIIDKQQAQLKELDKLAQAVFYDMFGDPRENEKGFPIMTIGETCILKSGDSSANNSAVGNLPYVKVGDMSIKENNPYITTSSTFVDRNSNIKHVFPIGTIIFPKRGGAIFTNKKRITAVEICCDLNTMGVIPKEELFSVYLYHYFLSIDFGELCNGAAIPQLNNIDIAPLRINMPPLSLQQSFAVKIESIENQKAAISQSIAETQKLFDYTMDKYFG